jgi:hypothetical protein
MFDVVEVWNPLRLRSIDRSLSWYMELDDGTVVRAVAKFNFGCLYLVFFEEDLTMDLVLVGDTGRTEIDALSLGEHDLLFVSVLIRLD